jgi:hypothetical protein
MAIVDKIPDIVSWHSKKSKDPSTDDASFASFNSSLTPSVTSRQDLENLQLPKSFEDLIAEFGDQVDETLTAADPSNISGRFMEHESPAARNSLASEETPPQLPSRAEVSLSGYSNSIAQKSKDDESITVPSTKVPSVKPRWTPKAAPDLPPAFQALASYSQRSPNVKVGKRPRPTPRCRPTEEDDLSTVKSGPSIQSESLHSRSTAPTRSTRSSSVRKIVPEDETKKVAKAEAADALKNRMRSRWEEINELRHSGHEPAKKVKERVASRKEERREKVEDNPDMAQPKQTYKEKKQDSASSVPANGTKEKKSSTCVVTQPKSRSKGESKSRKAESPKKGRSKKEKDGLNGSNCSTGSRSVKRAKSTSSLNGRSKKEKDGLNGSNYSTSSRSLKSTKSTSSSNISHGKDSGKSSSKNSSKKNRRQPKSLVQPERLAAWQIQEQLRHRVTPINQLYNRRLDDDDDDDDGDKEKGKKKKSKKAVSAIQNPRGTQKADGGYLGAKERRHLKGTRESLKKSILDSVVQFDETESNLTPAFRRLSSKQ